MKADIRDFPDIINSINEIINKGGTAEIKDESRNSKTNILTVVEVKRKLVNKSTKSE